MADVTLSIMAEYAKADGSPSLAFPGEPDYAAATGVFNLAAPLHPAAAVTARTVDQVREVIDRAGSERLSVRVHTTGHAASSARPMEGAVLIRTLLDGAVEIDSERRVARVPAGTRWGAVVEAAAPHGLTAPHGSSAGVGVVGYLLRGGLSFYGRRAGLAVNSVRAVELVTADGELRRADAATDPELFWALRGGGGGFGVVTALEIDLFPAAGVVTGAAFWPAAHADGLLGAWLRWSRTAPRAATTSLQVLNLPPLPDLPPALTAGPVLCVDGAILDETGDGTAERHAEELLGPLRALTEPLIDTWQPTTLSGVLDAHVEPDEPVALIGDHLLLGELGDEGAAEFLRVTGEGSPLIAAGLRQLGGAFSEAPAGAGALGRLDAAYAYSGAGGPQDPAGAEAIRKHCATVRAALAPWDTGRTVPSFVESVDQPQGHLDPRTAGDVERIRGRVDPAGLFRGDVMTVGRISG